MGSFVKQEITARYVSLIEHRYEGFNNIKVFIRSGQWFSKIHDHGWNTPRHQTGYTSIKVVQLSIDHTPLTTLTLPNSV